MSGSSIHGYGLSHSPGDMRPRINRQIETPSRPIPRYIHTSLEKGDIKEKSDGGCFVGLRYKIVMPKFMNGIVKSTALSRSDVMVKSVMAKSAR